MGVRVNHVVCPFDQLGRGRDPLEMQAVRATLQAAGSGLQIKRSAGGQVLVWCPGAQLEGSEVVAVFCFPRVHSAPGFGLAPGLDMAVE